MQELKAQARVAHVSEEMPDWESKIRELCNRKHRLDIILGALARMMRAILLEKKEQVQVHPADWEIERAERVLLAVFSREVRQAQEDKKLRSLFPFEQRECCTPLAGWPLTACLSSLARSPFP